MSGERGSALVQVLIMSILLIILATGVLQVVFQNHVLVGRVQRFDKYKAATDACMAQKYSEWAVSGVSCQPNQTCLVNGMTVTTDCPGGKANFTAVDSTW